MTGARFSGTHENASLFARPSWARTTPAAEADLAFLAAATRGGRSFTVMWAGDRVRSTVRAALAGRVPNGPACTAVLIRRLVSRGLIVRASLAPWGVEGFALTYDGMAALDP